MCGIVFSGFVAFVTFKGVNGYDVRVFRGDDVGYFLFIWFQDRGLELSIYWFKGNDLTREDIAR